MVVCLTVVYCCTLDPPALTGTESRCPTTLSSMWTGATNSPGGQQVCELACELVWVDFCVSLSTTAVTADAVQTAVHAASLTQQHDTTAPTPFVFPLRSNPHDTASFLITWLSVSVAVWYHTQASSSCASIAARCRPCRPLPAAPTAAQSRPMCMASVSSAPSQAYLACSLSRSCRCVGVSGRFRAWARECGVEECEHSQLQLCCWQGAEEAEGLWLLLKESRADSPPACFAVPCANGRVSCCVSCSTCSACVCCTHASAAAPTS